MALQNLIYDAVQLFRQPADYFRRFEGPQAYRPGLRLIVVLLAGSTLLLFIAAVANLGALREASREMERALPGFQASGIANAAPWNRLIFAVFWFVLLAIVGFSRHLTVMLLGEKNRMLAVTQAISFVAFSPAIVLLTLSGLVATFFPIVPGPLQSAGVRFSIWISLIAVLASVVLDARICITGFKAAYGQNTGRAVLTWLSPIIMLASIGFVFYVTLLGLVIAAR